MLTMENRKLEEKLMKEINLNEEKRFEMEKMEQRYLDEIDNLKMQNESLKNKLQLYM